MILFPDPGADSNGGVCQHEGEPELAHRLHQGQDDGGAEGHTGVNVIKLITVTIYKIS
jgi:hypothetical protein